jgi:hypothetical protein
MGGFEGTGGAAQNEREHPGPWLWQRGQWGAAAGEGGRRVNRLEGTRWGARPPSRRRSCVAPRSRTASGRSAPGWGEEQG